MIWIGDPVKADSRGLLLFNDDQTAVFPGYRMRELPSDVADGMVQFVDHNSERRYLAWQLPPETEEDEEERRVARIVKRGVRAFDNTGLTWEVLIDDMTGEALVSGSHFRVWGGS
jgi:hypothetical protein